MSTTVRKFTVLVVDDDPAITSLVRRFLTNEFGDKLTIEVVNDAQAARQRLERLGCDILISDIEMPEYNGLEILRFTKQRSAWTQVIFMTAHSSWDHITAAIENGASDYLLKPINQADLIQVVQNECARLRRWERAVVGTMRKPAALASL